MVCHRECNFIKGSVEIILRDVSGKTVSRGVHQNLITSSGKMLLANIFRSAEKQGVTHIGVGTGSARASSTDLQLIEECLPRKPFDQNLIQEEKNAYIILKDKTGKNVIKLTSKLSGERGNNTRVEVKFNESRQVKNRNITVIISNDLETDEERFEGLVMDPESENYLIAKLNEGSELVSASVIEERLPGPLIPTALSGGSDIMVTLSSTFGYEDANGKLTEAGIFNSDRGGMLYNRVVFPEISKTDKFTLSLIWRITF